MTVSLAVPDVLVARAQAGDEAALEALYRAFETPVYNLIRRILRRPEDAEDVLQETFLEIVRNIKQYRGEGHLWGWIRHCLYQGVDAHSPRSGARDGIPG